MCIGQNCASEQQMQQLRNKWPQNVTNSVNASIAQTGNKLRYCILSTSSCVLMKSCAQLVMYIKSQEQQEQVMRTNKYIHSLQLIIL